MFKFELSAWEDGTICLSYWATVYGNDVNIVLHPDGRAELQGYTKKIDGLVLDGVVEVWTEIDLVPFLRSWLLEMAAAVE